MVAPAHLTTIRPTQIADIGCGGGKEYKEIPNGVYLTGFFSNYPGQKTMNDIFKFLDEHHLSPERGAFYKFDDIRKAAMDLDHHRTDGKIVIVVGFRAAAAGIRNQMLPHHLSHRGIHHL